LAAPAIAQSMPERKWRLASSFPKSLDTLFGAGEVFAKYIQEMTDNKFQIRVFAAGEIVPGLQVLDAVQNGTIEMGHSAGTYYVGKDPALAIDTALPFGTNARQQEAWIRWGGGRELLNALYKWNELPKNYKAIIEAASAYAQTWMVSKYDAENPKALRELVAGGTKLMPFSQPLMEAAFAASNELYAELSAKSPKFKKIYE